MRILLLGATGLIGRAILPELRCHGHSILALARSDIASDKLNAQGVEVLRGDLCRPDQWSESIHDVDGVIHVAATFTHDMGDIDRRLIQALVAQAQKSPKPIRFIYTGGAWLYGDSGGTIVTEQTAFNPIASFAWMIENRRLLAKSRCFTTNTIHPAMVYVRDGGELSRLMPKDGRIEIWGRPETRWPLVHADDLAVAYRLVLESDSLGESYNVCAEQGVRQQDIAHVISNRFGLQTKPRIRSTLSLVTEYGQWAEGPVLDQRMSSEKIRTQLGWKPVHLDVLAELV